jgi:hypothetical protein
MTREALMAFVMKFSDAKNVSMNFVRCGSGVVDGRVVGL